MNKKRLSLTVTAALSVGALMLAGCATTTESVAGDEESRSAAPATESPGPTPTQLRTMVDAMEMNCGQFPGEPSSEMTWTKYGGNAFWRDITYKGGPWSWPDSKALPSSSRESPRAIGMQLDASKVRVGDGRTADVKFAAGAGEGKKWKTQQDGQLPSCIGQDQERPTAFQLSTSYEQNTFQLMLGGHSDLCVTAQGAGVALQPCNQSDSQRVRITDAGWTVDGKCMAFDEWNSHGVSTDRVKLLDCGSTARTWLSIRYDNHNYPETLMFSDQRAHRSMACVTTDSPSVGGRLGTKPCDRNWRGMQAFALKPNPTKPWSGEVLGPVAGAPDITGTYSDGRLVATCQAPDESGAGPTRACEVTSVLGPETSGDLRAGLVNATVWNLPITVAVENKSPGPISVATVDPKLSENLTGGPVGAQLSGLAVMQALPETIIGYNKSSQLDFARVFAGKPRTGSAYNGRTDPVSGAESLSVRDSVLRLRFATASGGPEVLKNCVARTEIDPKDPAWAKNCGFIDIVVKANGGSAPSGELSTVTYKCEVAGVSMAASGSNQRQVEVAFAQDPKGDRTKLGPGGFLDARVVIHGPATVHKGSKKCDEAESLSTDSGYHKLSTK